MSAIQKPKLRLELIEGDITKIEVDVIVNAANSRLLPGGGVCGAIFDAAGSELEVACNELGGCDIGEAKITEAYNLTARYIVHTVGPIYNHSNGEDSELLWSCFYNSLLLASERQAESIAFPAISAGSHGYPITEVLTIANLAVNDFSIDNPESSLKQIFFVYYQPENTK